MTKCHVYIRKFNFTRVPYDSILSSRIVYLRMCGWLHCALAAAQCIVIGPVCLWVGGYVSGRYHNNSKLCASILTKLGL